MDRMICFIGVPHVTPTAHDTSWLWNVAVVSRPSRGSFTGLRGNSEKLEKEYTVCCGFLRPVCRKFIRPSHRADDR